MKQFVKVLEKDKNCFKYLCSKSPGPLEEELNEGIFVGTDISDLDEMFETTMLNIKREAWIALKVVISKFMGNYRDYN
jgi:hypothetical protein